MKVCYICKQELGPDPQFTMEVDVGGPNEGCSEFAEEWHTVPVCSMCFGELDNEGEHMNLPYVSKGLYSL